MGHVQILRGVPSRAEGFDRTVRIYTPDAYDQRPHERFGVLYMHDGQNVFAHAESARAPDPHDHAGSSEPRDPRRRAPVPRPRARRRFRALSHDGAVPYSR